MNQHPTAAKTILGSLKAGSVRTSTALAIFADTQLGLSMTDGDPSKLITVVLFHKCVAYSRADQCARDDLVLPGTGGDRLYCPVCRALITNLPTQFFRTGL